jgi:hypothetical protein
VAVITASVSGLASRICVDAGLEPEEVLGCHVQLAQPGTAVVFDWSTYILVWIVCGIAAFLIAQNRGATNAPTWFLVGLLLGPIGILLAAVGAKGPGPTGGVVVGAADELAKLADLRDRGIVTPDEFERQKAALLARSPEPSTAISGRPRLVFYGIVTFLVVVIVWFVIQII